MTAMAQNAPRDPVTQSLDCLQIGDTVGFAALVDPAGHVIVMNDLPDAAATLKLEGATPIERLTETVFFLLEDEGYAYAAVFNTEITETGLVSWRGACRPDLLADCMVQDVVRQQFPPSEGAWGMYGQVLLLERGNAPERLSQRVWVEILAHEQGVLAASLTAAHGALESMRHMTLAELSFTADERQLPDEQRNASILNRIRQFSIH